jgi:hypothetical protein
MPRTCTDGDELVGPHREPFRPLDGHSPGDGRMEMRREWLEPRLPGVVAESWVYAPIDCALSKCGRGDVGAVFGAPATCEQPA